jgi:hypothetical protein
MPTSVKTDAVMGLNKNMEDPSLPSEETDETDLLVASEMPMQHEMETKKNEKAA